jgi:hypothetical protein
MMVMTMGLRLCAGHLGLWLCLGLGCRLVATPATLRTTSEVQCGLRLRIRLRARIRIWLRLRLGVFVCVCVRLCLRFRLRMLALRMVVHAAREGGNQSL